MNKILRCTQNDKLAYNCQSEPVEDSITTYLRSSLINLVLFFDTNIVQHKTHKQEEQYP